MEYYAAVEEKWKKEEWRYAPFNDLEISPESKTRILSFACVCIEKLEGYLKKKKKE